LIEEKAEVAPAIHVVLGHLGSQSQQGQTSL
jgi:hypothetical protein